MDNDSPSGDLTPHQPHDESQNQQLKIVWREPECLECRSWFFGCLNGRERWKDKAITPNYRTVVLSDGSAGKLCDAFEYHPDPCRKGRAVYDCTCGYQAALEAEERRADAAQTGGAS